ncbi:MAG: histone deacetylase family protein [Longimicrobiales bacterium]
MHAYYCDHFVLPLPDGHRFPMEKYRLLRERVATELPGTQMFVPPAATRVELERVHEADYVTRVWSGSLEEQAVRKMGFPWSRELVERSRRSVGGTIAAARSALNAGTAVNLAGGTHHAFRDRGEGFCVFNDVAVSVLAMRTEGRIQRAAILDLDVHQGDGTAAIFEHDPDTFTASVHGENNFPFKKTTSDLDVPLPDGAGDDAFLSAVDRALGAAVAHGPELVYFIAGADPYTGDRLGRLDVSKETLATRDQRVADVCRTKGIPLVTVMAGGYAVDVADTVDIHFHSVRTMAKTLAQPSVGVA